MADFPLDKVSKKELLTVKHDFLAGTDELLVRFEQVMNVGARVVGAGVAVAAIKDGREVGLETRISEVHTTLGRIDGGVTSNARGRDTVKGINTVFDTHENIIGF